jgi:hypothetical protein
MKTGVNKHITYQVAMNSFMRIILLILVISLSFNSELGA